MGYSTRQRQPKQVGQPPSTDYLRILLVASAITDMLMICVGTIECYTLPRYIISSTRVPAGIFTIHCSAGFTVFREALLLPVVFKLRGRVVATF